VIGTTVRLNGEPHEIVGVMPNGFDVRMLEQPRGAQLWTLIAAGERGYDATGMGPVALFARLRRDTTLASAQAELNRLQLRIEAPFPEPQRLSQFPVLLTRLQDDNTRTIRATLVTVISAVGCLLLIACMNVGTLVLGRGLGRLQEAALRAALGSGYGRLVRQFLTESLLLAALGGAIGLAVAAVAVRLFVTWDPLGMLPASSIEINVRALLATIAIVGLTVIIAGLVPALRIAAADPQQALRTGGDRGATGRGQRAQSLLLGTQLAVSLMMLVMTSLLGQTFVTLTRAPLGFEPSHLAIVDLNVPLDTGSAQPTASPVTIRAVRTRGRAYPGDPRCAASRGQHFAAALQRRAGVGAHEPRHDANAQSLQRAGRDQQFFRDARHAACRRACLRSTRLERVVSSRDRQRAGRPPVVFIGSRGDSDGSCSSTRNSRAK
jgi:hypothetical protein